MGSPQGRSEARERFFAAVSKHVDPQMTTLGFVRISGIGQDTDGEASVLYEHGPEEFARRFPKLKEDFGTEVAPCIDIWVNLDTRTAELERRLGDLFHLEEWLRDSGSSTLADLIWERNADIDQRMKALAEALTAYFSQ